jgi:TonB family protein
VIGAVVVLHVLTAMALTMVETPTPIVEPLKVTSPIRIDMIAITPPLVNINEVAIEQLNVEEEQLEPVREINTQPETKAVTAISSKAIQKPTTSLSKPATQSKSSQSSKDVNVEKVQQETKEKLAPVINNNNAAIEAKELHQIAAMQAHTKAMIQAQNERDTEALRQQNIQAAQALAKSEAALETAAAAEKAAQQQRDTVAKKAAEQVAQQATQKVVSSEPISYGNIGNSSWIVEPRLEAIKNKNYSFTSSEVSLSVSFTVDTGGKIGNTKITKSSGNNEFNRDFMRALLQAKLRPATRGNVAVESIAHLPFRMIL